ncbi:MAG: peptidase M16, partial [Bacteroidetes bacterium HGW-Bacteroidetes-11]
MNLHLKTSFLVLSMLAALLAGAQNKISFTEYDLDNGLHVILHQDNSTPIVAVTISYHVGSKNENPERTGFAHFFEHLMFEGSQNIERGEFDKIAMNAGAALNANTSFDRTFYYLLLPSNQLELGLWMESERLVHLRIDSLGVETQRSVVKEERKQSYDNL